MAEKVFDCDLRFNGPSGPVTRFGNGSPEGVVAAPVGSEYRRLDGGVGTTFYIKESGVGNTGWTAVASGGGGGSGDVTGPASSVNNAVPRFDGTTGKIIQGSGALILDAGEMTLPLVTNPATPAIDTLNVFARKRGGRMVLGMEGPSGLDTSLQPFLGGNSISFFRPNGNATTVNSIGFTLSVSGTATLANVAKTNRHTKMKRIDYLVTTAATNAVARWGTTATQYSVGDATAGDGGFFAVFRWGPATGVATTTHRGLCGFVNSLPADVEPSSIVSMLGMGWDAADANIQFMHNDGSGVATKIDLGAAFPVPTTDRTAVYEIALFSPPGPAQSVSYEITNLATGDVATGTVTTNLPSTSTLLAPIIQLSVGGTSSVIGLSVMSVYVETDY